MVEFNRKKPIRKFIYSPSVLVVLFIILLLLLRAVWGVYTKQQISANYLGREEREYNKMISRQKELAAAVEFLKTDKGVESEIRTKFRAVKDGEAVAVIIDEDAPTSTPIQATSTPSFWKRIVGFFGF